MPAVTRLLAMAAIVLALPAAAQEPDTMRASRLPAALKPLHSCAAPGDEVDVTRESFAKATMFIVSGPAKAGRPVSLAVYMASDKQGHGAKRVSFPVPAAYGGMSSLDLLSQADPARELVNKVKKNDPPWLTGVWEPTDRPGICLVLGHWRIAGDQSELMLWEEAKECPTSGPKYENKLNRNPPELVGR